MIEYNDHDYWTSDWEDPFVRDHSAWDWGEFEVPVELFGYIFHAKLGYAWTQVKLC